jgi:hypothetical protein
LQHTIRVDAYQKSLVRRNDLSRVVLGGSGAGATHGDDEQFAVLLVAARDAAPHRLEGVFFGAVPVLLVFKVILHDKKPDIRLR